LVLEELVSLDMPALDELVSLDMPDLDGLDLPELVSLEVRWPIFPGETPRAFKAAQVAAVSTPPCELHAPLGLLAVFEPSLHTTVSAALIRIRWRRWWTRPLSPAVGPVCTPGSALSAVSVAAP
jgi:hypothetical protein